LRVQRSIMRKHQFHICQFLLRILLLSVGFLSMPCFAADSYYFFVQFTDKNNTTFSLDRPEEFLSAKAISRRMEQGIAYDSTDLPVNPDYLTQLTNHGLKIHSSSKWMNGATVLLQDSSLMAQIRLLPFVKTTEYTGIKTESISPAPRKINKLIEEYDYGTAATQIGRLNGAALHNAGYTGKDIIIGVIDAGFQQADNNIAFDSLHLQNRLLGTVSIIDSTIDVFREDAHGANVLSIMAANIPQQYFGTAPHASYWLIQTEYVPTEYKVEVDFLVRGLEYADSVGVDVVNISLGYFEFDDPVMNFTYDDMNGKFSRASRAATLATQKGIIICNSAGNEGNSSWKYIASPSDAEGILSVGAVDMNDTIAYFSSYGPSADGRTKPEVCAIGLNTALINRNGNPATGNGTSYSSPVIAGLMACYLQYCKEKIPHTYDVEQILTHIVQSSDRYNHPDERYGYGIPDFQEAMNSILTDVIHNRKKDTSHSVHYIPGSGDLKIMVNPFTTGRSCQVNIFTANGNLRFAHKFYDSATIHLNNYAAGIYMVQVISEDKISLTKIMIH